jgi:hypothetical protein
LNNYNQLEQWQSTLYALFEKTWFLYVSSSCSRVRVACPMFLFSCFVTLFVYLCKIIILCIVIFRTRSEDDTYKNVIEISSTKYSRIHLPLHTDVPTTIKLGSEKKMFKQQTNSVRHKFKRSKMKHTFLLC